MNDIIGVDKRCYPSNLTDRGYVEITVVLVEGAIGDYAAYIGHGTKDFIRSSGDKLSFREAQQHFPDIEKEKYRER
jgi:hypothetical protein